MRKHILWLNSILLLVLLLLGAGRPILAEKTDWFMSRESLTGNEGEVAENASGPGLLEHPVWLIGIALVLAGFLGIVGVIAAFLVTRYRPAAARFVWMGCGGMAVVGLLVVAVGVAVLALGVWPRSESETASAPPAISLGAAISTQVSAAETRGAATVTPAPVELTLEPTEAGPATATFAPMPSMTTTPTPTPSIPTSTPRPTLTPADTATPTPTSIPRSSLLVENAQHYADAAALQSAYSINDASDVAGCTLGLAAAPHQAAGDQAIAFTFTIQHPAPNDYCGFERWLPVAQDWSGYTELCIAVELEGAADELVVQFGETGGEVWKSWTAVNTLGTGELCLPLSSAAFSWANWSVKGNQRIDLGTIDYYGIYIHGAPGAQGVLYVKQLRVLSR